MHYDIQLLLSLGSFRPRLYSVVTYSEESGFNKCLSVLVAIKENMNLDDTRLIEIILTMDGKQDVQMFKIINPKKRLFLSIIMIMMSSITSSEFSARKRLNKPVLRTALVFYFTARRILLK